MRRAQGQGTQAGLRPCFQRGYLLTDGALDDDGYDEVWHAASAAANQQAVAMPCACPTRTWFAHFLGFRQHMQVGLYHTERPLSQLTPTLTRLLQSTHYAHTELLQNTHPRCLSQIDTVRQLFDAPPV